MTKYISPNPKSNLPTHSIEETVRVLTEQENRPVQLEDETLDFPRLTRNILWSLHRNRAAMDWLIERFAKSRVRPIVRHALWWAMTEILFLDGIQPPAVVNTTVDFIRRRRNPAEAGFVNAFLHRLTAALETQKWDDLTSEAPESVRLGLPEILFSRWRSLYGKAGVVQMAEACRKPTAIVLRLRAGFPRQIAEGKDFLSPLPSPEWAPHLSFFALKGKPDASLTALLDGNAIADHSDGTSSSPAFYIQDPATLLAPEMLSPRPGEIVADLCSAPGGKAVRLAEMLEGKGTLICADCADSKLGRLRQNLSGFSNVSFAIADARHPTLPAGSLDALLLDVPCTNTGVLRRKPEARWSFTKQKLQELVILQQDILSACAPLLRPGGRLVYSTCSVEPEENIEQIALFLKRHSEFSMTAERQLLPSAEHDGAYAACLLRTDTDTSSKGN